MTMTETPTKTCTRCGRALPLDAFGLVRDDRPWRKPKCRECNAEQQRERRANRKENLNG